MAHVRIKPADDRTYYHLVESRRERKKVRRHAICYLDTKPRAGDELESILMEVEK